MATWNNFYYPDQPQAPLWPDTIAYQYDRQQSKTPVSHDGYSPVPSGPLRTPPHSRYPSQPPAQGPDQMISDGTGSSGSNSPTSAITSDNDLFEEMILDESDPMQTLFQNRSALALAGQTSHGVMEPFLSDQAIDQALQDTLAAQDVIHRQVNSQYNSQQQQQGVFSSQLFTQGYSQSYTNQPFDQEPWNPAAPLRGPEVPRSSVGMFDMGTDPFDYTPNVNDWAMNQMDPGYMYSPFSASAPPSDNRFFLATQNLGPADIVVDPSPTETRSSYSPLDVTLTEASPSPDSQKFVNFNQSSPFFNNYIPDTQLSPSPGTSVIGIPSNSPYQTAVSPQISAPSPMSDRLLYQLSEPDMILDAPDDNLDLPSLHPQSPVQLDLVMKRPRSKASSRTVSQASTRTLAPPISEPDSEPETSQPVPTRGTNGRSGGRQLGTHLNAEVARAAHDMRKIVACWHCVLQRDRCGPGEICERCHKRSLRPNADCGLGCSRMKLMELAPHFLPTLLTQNHENAYLMQFAERHIHGWMKQEIIVMMTCGQDKMPRFPVRVYEFQPKDDELLVQIQYEDDPRTNKRMANRYYSPALGMQQINANDEKKYDKYINDIVDGHLDNFAKLCWHEDDNDFQQNLFKLMIQLKPTGDDEVKLLREVFRLVVCTYIMSHVISIAQETKSDALSQMHQYMNLDYSPRFTSSRLTNRQLKFFFNRIQKTIETAILNRLQQIFKSSKGCDKWLAAFIAVIGLCMAHEDQQKTLHLVMWTKAKTEHLDYRDLQSSANIACQDIDEKTNFISQIFRWKYNRRCNPLKDAEQDWEGEAGFGNANSVTFVRQVAQLVKDNVDFLQNRQNVSISYNNQTKYTSRLVSRFLNSFWLPS